MVNKNNVKCPCCGSTAQPKLINNEYYRCGCGCEFFVDNGNYTIITEEFDNTHYVVVLEVSEMFDHRTEILGVTHTLLEAKKLFEREVDRLKTTQSDEWYDCEVEKNEDDFCVTSEYEDYSLYLCITKVKGE